MTISANYPGATAQTLEDSVTQLIEQGMTGIDHLKYISANSTNAGQSNVTLTFDAGTDANIAQVQVQNQLQQIIRRLPQEVQTQGLNVNKANANPLLTIVLYDTKNLYANADIGDYIATHLQDTISRVDGVGTTNIFGAQYAMRIWLDPARLAAFSLTPQDVVNAIRAQNAQVSAGQIGSEPTTPDAALNAAVTAQSRLTNVAQFQKIIVKTGGDGASVYLKDVARVERGSENYASISRLNGHLAVGLQVRLAAGANALKTADAVKAAIAELAKDFPEGLTYEIPNDSTTFVKLSIEDVAKTLLIAIGLVFVVIFVFLQNWRATLIPTLAIPVVLLGTFGILAAFHYSINTLTMFGLVLAIGLLVDDAIVVVENVERVMAEQGLSPLEATRKSMDEITGALIGVASVLAAMFVPMAFFGGTQGVIYRQFSITLVSAMALSVVVALVLTPPLCATLLKPPKKHKPGGLFSGMGTAYRATVHGIIKTTPLFIMIYGGLIAGMVALFLILPTSFLPEEDQGVIQTLVQLPVGSTTAQTQKILQQVEAQYRKDPAVKVVFALAGSSFSVSGSNVGQVIARMKPINERQSEDLKVFAVVERAKKAFARIRGATIVPTIPPVVRDLGSSTGFDIQLKDTGGLGHAALMAARKQFVAESMKDNRLTGVRAAGQDDTPQLKLDIDAERAGSYGVTISDINTLLSTAWGGTYVNDYVDNGRVKRVLVQADAPYRMRPDDLNAWFVRNSSGQMVPFGNLANAHWIVGSPRLERFNGSPSMEVQGTPAKGISSGAAMDIVAGIADHLPQGISYEWAGLSLQERESGAQAPALYAVSLLVVFLLLAALYESWSIPFSVILVVPLGILGALAATFLRGLSNDIYFQVGLLTTMGLSAKNAILIVEFARQLYHSGTSLVEATLEAARIRLRPIIMTSLAFSFGILPLVLTQGAGANTQHAIGTGLLGGVITATLLAIFFVPMFYVLIERMFGKRPTPPSHEFIS